MTQKEVFDEFVQKVKSGEYDLFTASRGYDNGLRTCSFGFVVNTPTVKLLKKLLEENREVAERMVKLKNFMKSDIYCDLSAKEQRLMIIQYNAMQTYADVLLQRVDELKERKLKKEIRRPDNV